MDIMTWNPLYSPIILHMKSLASDHVSTIYPILLIAPIIPILLIAAIIAVVAIMILREAGALTPHSIIHRLGFRKILRSVHVRN
jgi:hypothetical protein